MAATLDTTIKPENPITYKYVKILRLFLYSYACWPGEEFGEKVSYLIRYHRKYVPVQAIILFFGQMHYIFEYWNKIDFLVKGHCYITSFLTIMTVIRSYIPNLKTYGKIVKKFITTFHLGHFKHKGEYYQEMFTTIDRASYIFTLYMMSMMVGGMILFNVSPCYRNYKMGVFSGKLVENATPEFSILYSFPGFQPEDTFTAVTIFNLYLSYGCSICVCSIDLLLSVMVFQIIGHILILQHNLETIPRPSHVKTAVVDGVEPLNNITISVEVYDEREHQMIHEKLKECIVHHTFIVSFTKELSAFFGPLLGFNYAFQLVSLCLLLLECSQGADALVRFGPLTVIIFGQLVLISVTFEIVGTVSTKLKESTYETPWEYMNTRNRRTVCIMLNRVQTPIHVTAMGLTTVGVTTMTSIIKTTFSYFAFLQSRST